LTYHITSGNLVSGDSFSGALSRAAGENVDSYAIGQGSVALSSNYALSYAGADLTVNKAMLTATADAKSKVYGAADPALTYTASDTADIGGGVSRAIGSGAAANVGGYAIRAPAGTAASYDVISDGGALMAVKTAALTATADAKSKVYGAADPALTYTAGGTTY